jgi:hypothetical protein
MNTWAVLAAKQAAVASGLGAGVVPALGTGSLEAFTLGALVSGTCILLLTSPRRQRSRRLPVAAGRGRAAGRAVLAAPRGRDGAAAGDEPQITTPPLAPDDAGAADGEFQDPPETTYRSRHRLADQDASPRRLGARRSAPRHAAPPASFSSRMTSRVAGLALAGGPRG